MNEIPFVSADEAVSHIKSHSHVHLSSVASVPHILIQALCRRADAGDVEDLSVGHGLRGVELLRELSAVGEEGHGVGLRPVG